MSTKLDTSAEDIPECIDHPYELLENYDEWIDLLSSTRMDLLWNGYGFSILYKVDLFSNHLGPLAVTVTPNAICISCTNIDPWISFFSCIRSVM